MIENILKIIFQVFSFDPVYYCCGFAFVIALFGLVRRFVWSDWKFRE